MLVVIVALLLREAGVKPQRGTGSGTVQAPAGESVVSLARASASDYDPLGDEDEHHSQAARVVDRDPGTSWTTESYRDGLAGADKAGVGIYLDAKPGVEAVRMEIQSAVPGWKAEIYGAAGARAPETHRVGLDEARRRHRAQRPPALQARRRRQALPLLPRLDHRAAAGPAARRDQRDRALPEGIALERMP